MARVAHGAGRAGGKGGGVMAATYVNTGFWHFMADRIVAAASVLDEIQHGQIMGDAEKQGCITREALIAIILKDATRLRAELGRAHKSTTPPQPATPATPTKAGSRRRQPHVIDLMGAIQQSLEQRGRA
jgi:hypothetical protein